MGPSSSSERTALVATFSTLGTTRTTAYWNGARSTVRAADAAIVSGGRTGTLQQRRRPTERGAQAGYCNALLPGTGFPNRATQLFGAFLGEPRTFGVSFKANF